ncbi:type IV secretion protein Rhs [Amycolatopsis rhizosphaerae]|uniref:Type IV secretion protein Rhs n=1 Tax=Amycolatopsis rhizosphaerae TaxID=2053003 RepID=A0A558APY5_9PSEU|nr:DUF6531 domain-containing protein [Amycolatopsis rhizosphaerae]TVT26320.1 type IV secretion protein Rhs [Amycolatopsis rhizosphaerae]
MDLWTMAMKPVGTLISYGLNWLIEHVQPLQDALNQLAGDADQIAAYSQTWKNVAQAVQKSAKELTDTVGRDTAHWTGQAADTYRANLKNKIDHLGAAATCAETIGTVVQIVGVITGAVRGMVRDMVTQAVGDFIQDALEEVCSLGLGTPAVVAQVVEQVSAWIEKIGALLKKLINSVEALRPMMSKLEEIFAAIKKVMNALHGHGGEEPHLRAGDDSTHASSSGDEPHTGTGDGTRPSGTDEPSTGPSGTDGTTGSSSPDEPSSNGTSTQPSGSSGPPKVENSEPPKTSKTSADTPATDDPIDLTTGRVFLDQVDVELPGTLPLVLSRSHRSDHSYGRWFGPTWSSTVDQKIEVAGDEVHFVAADGMLLTYPVPAAGEPVLPVHGTPWPLARAGDGGFTVTNRRLGRTLHFAAGDGDRLPISAITDRNGNRIDFRYDAGGLLAEITHSGGYRVLVATEDGLISELHLANPEGQDIPLKRYRYDAGRRLVEVVNSSGRPVRFDYDPAGRLTGWEDTNGMWYRYRYDGLGRCVEARGAGGFLDCTLEFDERNRTTRRTNSLGHTTTYQLNEQFQIVREIDPLGAETVSEWDRHHRLLSRTGPLGNTFRYRYDEDGNLTAIERPDGTRAHAEYNGQGLPVGIVAPGGARWRQEYDDRGNRTAAVDPAGAVTRYAYDERGCLVSSTNALGQTTRIDNDRAGLPVAVTAPDGAVTRYRRDVFGRVSAIIDPLGGMTRFGWTVEGKPLSRTLPDGATERWSYDGEGNTLSHIDALGNTTRVEVNHFDLPVAETGPDGSRLEFRYDTELRRVAVVDSHGLTWRYHYDAAGNLVGQTDFNGRNLRYGYDAARRIAEYTNGNGEVTVFRRDALGNVLEEHCEGSVTTFGYDADGRLVRAANADADVLLQRDVLGRVVAETVNGRTVESAYDVLGRRIRRRTPSGTESTWEYGSNGRPSSLVAAGRRMHFGYDSAGRETRRLLGSVALTQIWDANHRLRAQSVTTSGAPGGRGRGERVLQRRSYRYRADGRVTRSVDQLAGAREYGLDANGRVASVLGDGWEERYAYDAAGNLVLASWPALGDDPDAAARGEREYAGALLRRAGKVSYRHDREGRVVCREVALADGEGRAWHYTWDPKGRMTAADTPEGQHWRYRYDALGRRIAKERLAQDRVTVLERVEFAWDGNVLAEQLREGGTTTWELEPGSFTPMLQFERKFAGEGERDRVDEAFYAIVADLSGSPAELVTPDGILAGRATASLWGVRSAVGPAECDLRFPGQYHDSETGLHYNFHRYYEPATARYQSSDPLGLAPSPNPYAYVSNPIWQIDPFGLYPQNNPDTPPGKKVLYHGSKDFEGDQFSLNKAVDGKREYTPEGGVYLTDDFQRAATQYGVGGRIVRVEVPEDFADSVRQLGGPGRNQPEYFVNTPEGIQLINEGITDVVPTNEAIMRFFSGNF